jgi:hypothetical protein
VKAGKYMKRQLSLVLTMIMMSSMALAGPVEKRATGSKEQEREREAREKQGGLVQATSSTASITKTVGDIAKDLGTTVSSNFNYSDAAKASETSHELVITEKKGEAPQSRGIKGVDLLEEISNGSKDIKVVRESGRPTANLQARTKLMSTCLELYPHSSKKAPPAMDAKTQEFQADGEKGFVKYLREGIKVASDPNASVEDLAAYQKSLGQMAEVSKTRYENGNVKRARFISEIYWNGLAGGTTKPILSREELPESAKKDDKDNMECTEG